MTATANYHVRLVITTLKKKKRLSIKTISDPFPNLKVSNISTSILNEIFKTILTLSANTLQ